MKALAKLYLDAAEMLDGWRAGWSEGACDAIFEVASVRNTSPAQGACELMSGMYEPNAILAGARLYWGANFGATYDHTGTYGNWEIDVDEAKQCRVLMLLFMSAMAEAGDI